MRYFFAFILFFFWLFTKAQNLYFKTYTTDEGLSNNSVTDIENDENGALWIATWDGLNYYDGHQFVIYKHKINDSTSIAGNEIYTLVKDSEKNIWIETNKSISKVLKSGKFKNYYFDKKIKNLFLSKGKKTIICFQDDTFLEFKNDSFQPISNTQIASNDEAIFKNILLDKYPFLHIKDVYKSNENTLLFATQYNGLYELKNSTNGYKITNYKKDLYDNKRFKSNEIEVIHEDVFGDVWLGFKDGGISLVQKNIKGIKNITPHPKKFPHLPNETIRAVTKDSNNDIWLGYYTKGLFKFSKQTNCFIPFFIPKAKENNDWNRVRSLYTASDGTIFAGTYAGIIKIKNNEIQYLTTENQRFLPNNRNYSFFESNKKIWIACWGGVAKFNLLTEKFEPFVNQENLSNFKIRNIKKYDSELMMATYENGVVFLNLLTGKISTFTEKNGLAGNSVFSILYDEETKKYWTSSLGGISVFDKNKKISKVITENNGLPSHMAYGILKGKKYFWTSTTKGIVKINKNSYETKIVGSKNSWQSQEFSEGAYFKDSVNQIFYFGGIKGLSYFSPNLLKENSYLPKISVKIDGKTKSIKQVISKEYANNYIKIQITPIYFAENENNTVLYRLKGYDSDWKSLNQKKFIYENLPPKRYVFEVKNSQDNSEKNILKYVIIIEKPFYLTFWFWSIITLAILLFTTLYLLNKIRFSKNYQKKLESEISKRIEVIQKQKTELLNLHNNLKNSEFEADKFKMLVVDKFKQPLAFLLEKIDSSPINPKEKKELKDEIKNLINRVLKWDYLSDISNLDDFSNILITSENLIKIVKKSQKKFEDKETYFELNTDVQTESIEINIIKHKLLIQYFFNAVLKFIQKNSKSTTYISITNENIDIQFNSDSKPLLKNIHYIQKYSTYYKAFSQILMSLKGTVKEYIDSNFISLKINIPVNSTKKTVISNSEQPFEITLPENKKTVLVYADKEDFKTTSSLLETDEYHLVYENDSSVIVNLLQKTGKFQLLILYNIPFTSKLLELLELTHKTGNTATMYISEQIDYLIQEKTSELHINDIIQLPVSKKFITNKVSKIIDNQNSKIKINTLKNSESELSANEKIANRALKIIEKNISNTNFNVNFLINELKTSRVKCYRIFKEVLKQSPSDIIIRYRMEKAINLIASNELNISEVSYKCGFNDPKYFSKVFKRYYGKSPKKYNDSLTKN